jgi:hypothetical protein
MGASEDIASEALADIKKITKRMIKAKASEIEIRETIGMCTDALIKKHRTLFANA